MKKIISLIILSLIFKGYVSACTKGADNKCTGNEEGKTIFVLEDESGVEKTLCSKVESPSAENCPNGVSLNPKKNANLNLEPHFQKLIRHVLKLLKELLMIFAYQLLELAIMGEI
jgi:hypothetical protein